MLRTAAAGIALVAIVSIWMFAARGNRPASELSGGDPRAPILERPDPPDAAGPPEPGSDPARLPADRAPPSAGGPGVVDSPDDRELVVRALDPNRSPLAGAEVEVFRDPLDDYSILERRRRRIRVADGVADRDGRFAARLARRDPCAVTVRAPGFGSTTVVGCYPGDVVEVILSPAARVFGIVSSPNGEPAVGTRVRLSSKRPEFGAPVRGDSFESDTLADGSYRIEDVAPGDYELRAFDARWPAPRSVEISLRPGEALRHDLRLLDGVQVAGRVVDAGTGTGIGGVEITDRWRGGRSVSSAADGTFAFPAVRPETRVLWFAAPGYAEACVPIPWDDRMESAAPVVAALERGFRVRGRVLGPDGSALEGAYVAAIASEHREPPLEQQLDHTSGRTDPAGRFELGALRRDLRYALFVRSEGLGTAVRALPPVDPDEDAIELPDLRMTPAATIRGSVVDTGGDPLPRLRVVLRGADRRRYEWTRPPAEPEWSLDGYLAVREAASDTRGRFSFLDLAAGSYTVSAAMVGVHDPSEVHVELDEGERREGVTLIIDRGEVIAGRVEVADGGAIPKTYVSVDPMRGTRSADVEVSPDGRFEARGLEPGPYRLTFYPYPSQEDRDAGRLFASTTVESVAAGRTDVVVVLRPQVSIRGRVVDVRGAPVVGAWVEARAGGRVIRLDRTGEDGAFELRLEHGAVVDLVGLPPDAYRDDWSPVVPDPGPERNVRTSRVEAGRSGVILRLRWAPPEDG